MDDDPGIIEETRRYIRDYDKLAESAKTVRKLYDKMLKLYPDGINPHPLWLGARAVKGQGLPFPHSVGYSRSHHQDY
jgi:hypothetical protein